MSARSVSERAGVSNRTFYECFSDREDCFLAAFNHAVDGLELDARAGWDSQLGWTARVRGALAALLLALDREPVLARLVIVEALSAGRVLSRRAAVLESLAGVIDRGREDARAPKGLPVLVGEGVVGATFGVVHAVLVGEGVVGATFGVVHARLLTPRPGPLIGLLGQLMASIVLPYRGSAAAMKELERPIPRPAARTVRRDGDGFSRRPVASASPVDYRLTVRTQMALAAVGGRPGLNNREISEVIGLSDQGQISRMMKRLAGQGLVENAQAHASRQVKAWRLTKDGEAVIDAHRPLKQAQRRAGKGGKLVTTRSAAGRRGKTQQIAAAASVVSTGLRMTALTHEVLAAVAALSERGPNPTNREIATAAAVKDEGQISKLLARLEHHGLLANTGGYPAAGNAWQLTGRGEQVLSAGMPSDRELAGAGVGHRRIASVSFRFLFAFLSPTRGRSRGARGHFPLRASCLHGLRGPRSKGTAVSRGARADARRTDSVSVLVRPLRNPWRMFEEVPSRALFPRAGIAGPTRCGPHAGPQRPLSSSSRESSSQPVYLAVGAPSASQAQRILPTAGQAGGGKAGYKTATNKVCRGRSDRAHARGTSESEPHGGLRTDGNQGRAGAPVLTCLSANRAERRFASDRGSVSKEGRDVTRAPVLTSISRTPQASVSLSCLSEGRRASAGVRVSVRQHKLGRGEGGGMHVMSAPGFSDVNHPSNCPPARKVEGASERMARSAPSLTQFGITGGDRLEDVHPHPSICTTERRRPWSLRPQALSERSESRYGGRQSLECLERRGCGAVSRTLKINPYSGTECVVVASRRGSAGARVSVRQHKLVRARGNREVSEVAGVKDQGQISKLMISRLEGHGLVENTKAFINSGPLGALSHNNRGAFASSPSIPLPSTESFLTRGGLNS